MTPHDRPIGVFDSGIGGLGVLKSIVKLLPHENLVYFADSMRCPYGPRSQKEIQEIIYSVVSYLLKHHDIKLAVAACNSATVAGIDFLRKEFPNLPFVGVVPVIKPASMLSETGNIGCLATDMTVRSETQASLIENHAGNVTVHNMACHGLVELIEGGDFQSVALENMLKEYIHPLLDKEIDVLALGCTHYTLVKDMVEKLVPESVKVMDSNDPVARRVKDVLSQANLLRESGIAHYEFLVHGDLNHYERSLAVILNGLSTNARSVTL